jgi:type II secretory pathway component PulK
MKKTILKILILFVIVLTSFSTNAQSIILHETKIAITKNGDTMLIMQIDDARFILSELMDKVYVDSLLSEYKLKDEQSTNLITIMKSQVDVYQQKSDNKDLQIVDLNNLITNKDEEILIKNTVIKKQKKEIRKQVAVKKIAISAAIILPLAIIFGRH